MDIRICIGRTWQQDQYEPINIQVEIVQKDVENYDSAYDSLYALAEKSLIESEIKLKEMYSPTVDVDRKPKKRISTEEKPKLTRRAR